MNLKGNCHQVKGGPRLGVSSLGHPYKGYGIVGSILGLVPIFGTLPIIRLLSPKPETLNPTVLQEESRLVHGTVYLGRRRLCVEGPFYTRSRICTIELLNEGYIGDYTGSIRLEFIRAFSSLRNKMTRGFIGFGD